MITPWIIALLLLHPVHAKMEGPLSRKKPVPTLKTNHRSLAIEKLIGVIRNKPVDVKIDVAPDRSQDANNRNSNARSGAIKPTGSTKSTVYFDESAAKGEKRTPPPIDESEAKKRSEHRNPPPGNSSGKPVGIPQRFDHMWPVCVFIDPKVGNGNQIVKELTDMAAECKVNLVAYPFYISSNYPKDPNALNSAAKRSCNAVQGMAQLGVSRASVVTLVSDAGIAQRMCGVQGDPKEFNSCAEVGYQVKEGQRARMEATGTWGGETKPGETAASIVGPGGLNASTVAGRVQGQGQMAMPFGAAAGNGTGDFGEGYATAGSGTKKGWSDIGCKKMRETAFPNTGNFKYLPTQENYVMLGKTLWDIQGERPVFNVSASSGASNPPSGSHPGKNKALSQDFFTTIPANPEGVAKNVLSSGTLSSEDGHKLRPPGTASSTAQSATSSKEGATASTKPKVKVGGQLSALDNGFMKENVPAEKRSLAQVEEGKKSIPSPTITTSKTTTVRVRISDGKNPLDPKFLNSPSKRENRATERSPGSSLRRGE